MTREEIVSKLSLIKDTEALNSAITHPAFDLFVEVMQDRYYGIELLSSAWEYFREGWEAA